MTAVCGGGASQLNPLAGSVVVGTAAVLEQIFAATPVWWAKLALVLVPVIVYDMNSACGSDPPTMPSFTTAEEQALLGVTPGPDLLSALAKMPDLIANVLWNQYCQCTGGGASTQPALPAPASSIATPGAYQLWNDSPNFATGSLGSSGFNYTWGQQARVTANMTVVALSVINSDGVASHNMGLWVNGHLRASITTSGETNLVKTITNIPPVNVLPGDLVTVGCYRPAGTAWRQQNGGASVPVGNPSGLVNGCYNLGAGLAYPGTSFPNWEYVSPWVTQASGSTSQPCCPPDPGLIALISSIALQVDLIQRQVVPFGYIASTSHAGLTGAGVITVSGLIGARVDTTTMPTQLGRAGTSPEEFFDVGFLTWGTADGFERSARIEHDPQLSFPPSAGAFTRLAYDLHSGVVATITELVREP